MSTSITKKFYVLPCVDFLEKKFYVFSGIEYTFKLTPQSYLYSDGVYEPKTISVTSPSPKSKPSSYAMTIRVPHRKYSQANEVTPKLEKMLHKEFCEITNAPSSLVSIVVVPSKGSAQDPYVKILVASDGSPNGSQLALEMIRSGACDSCGQLLLSWVGSSKEVQVSQVSPPTRFCFSLQFHAFFFSPSHSSNRTKVGC